ncbi:MAG: hypothetical protein H7319_20785 [Spirosoma sp.]|nr:hypothetical protein [Spirosoma sp.]
MKITEYENTILPNYEKEFSDFELFARSVQGQNKGNLLKMNKLSSFCFDNSSESVDYQSDYQPFTGVSELNFYNHLQEEIHTWQWISVDVVLSKSKSIPNSNYLPDILIECIKRRETVLYIDVEIDEPYIGSSGLPIHYTNFGNDDKKRDDFFLKNNWIVIRFSEEQVVKYPKECCKYILSIILSCTEPMGYESYIENWSAAVSVQNRWTKDEAHAMAFRRHRNTYLGRKLSEDIATES